MLPSAAVNVRRFFHSPSATGILLVSAAALAIFFANSFLSNYYFNLLTIPVSVQFGEFAIHKPLKIWVNDGLMAIFFFLVGLELKREFIKGHLSDPRQVVLPAWGALGGMLLPALIYLIFNYHDEQARKGWAIASATDIAFALGVLSLVGKKVPVSLKVFLASLAIFDDIGAIAIVAFFYTGDLSIKPIFAVFACVVVLFFLGRYKVSEKSPYLFVGILMWLAMLKSGLHPTITGVLVAVFIPLKNGHTQGRSLLKTFEEDLYPLVNFIILPTFAFFNAGIALPKLGLSEILHPIPVGIALGLFLGKQLGIVGFCWLAVKSKFAALPQNCSWSTFYGCCVLCGIGFTMSLFIGTLAFEGVESATEVDEKLGILMGSLLSAIVGYALLTKSLQQENTH